MEEPFDTRLPEVDSLPDGFVDSTAKPTGLPDPSIELEKLASDLRGDSRSTWTRWNDLTLGSDAGEPEMDNVMSDTSSKMREFTVSVTEYQNLDDTMNFLDGNWGSKGSGCEDLPEVFECCEVEEQADGEFWNWGISSEEELIALIANLKEFPSVDGDDLLKITEKQESAEIRRKSSQPGFKSVKEFAQFALGYQQVLSELDAAILARDNLESLCRELQHQNNTLMNECKRVLTEGQKLRLNLSAKFHDAIKEASNKSEQQKNECLSQQQENEMLKINLKQLADQYALSEKHHEQQLKQKSLELQIADLKVKQHEEKVAQECSQTKVYAEQISQQLENEENLRFQLNADGEKFQQLQTAMSKHNEVFETFKQEIEKMSKSTKDLQKENAYLKSKCQKTDLTIIELIGDRERMKKQMEKMKNQIDKLESLCRSLQAERQQNAVESACLGPVSA